MQLPQSIISRGWGIASYISTSEIERLVIKLRRTTDTPPPGELATLLDAMAPEGWQLITWFPTPDYHSVVLEKKA